MRTVRNLTIVHTPITASSIVLAGDSSGGALCLAVIQLLHYFRRNGTTHIGFHDASVPLFLPAGVALRSSYCDYTDALSSYTNTSSVGYSGEEPIYITPGFPSCSIWPTDPPRAVGYCEGFALCHPLVTPVIAEDWTRSPPVWFACGEESVADVCMANANRAAKHGVAVFWENYEGTPYNFSLLPGLSQSPQVKRCSKNWADVC